jgi:hypothetical protein
MFRETVSKNRCPCMVELHRWFISSLSRDILETGKVLAGKQTRWEGAQGSWSFLSSVTSF